MDIPDRFSPSFAHETTFITSFPVHQGPSGNGPTLKGKNLLPWPLVEVIISLIIDWNIGHKLSFP